MDFNTKINRSILNNHYIVLIMMSLFWIPFLYSAQSYQHLFWYNYLIISRSVLFALPLMVLTIALLKGKKYRSFIPNYYALAMLVQASHGLLEPSNKIDFYTYTSLFLFMGTMGFHGSTSTWLKRYLPIVILAHVPPLFFKDPIFFQSFGGFVDNFTFNVAFIMFSIILLNIMSDKFQVLKDNLALKDELLQEKDLRLQATRDISKQVAHDIRSPLTALKFSLDDIKKLPEDTRIRLQSAINRVEDIANNLLYSESNTQTETTTNAILLTTIIDSIISEKRQEYINLPKVRISSEFDSKSYGLFSSFIPATLKRILSNIVTNSVEAIGQQGGEIIVTLYQEDGNNVIDITDNGIGISEEIQKKIFQKGFTTKTNGTGLGLYHAKSEISKAGGSIGIFSRENSSTSIKIILPNAARPAWFVDAINLSDISTVLILDDDESIHHIWAKRLKEHSVIIKHYYNTTDLLADYSTIPADHLLLSDHELIGDTSTGLALILKLKVQHRSILITSHFEDEEILATCSQESLLLLPKPLAEIVPIEIQNTPKEIVLIDDDEIIHMTWKSYFTSRSIQLHSFHNVDDFLNNSNQIDKSIPIYIDSNLGNKIKGEIEAEKIFDSGYKKITLTTGYTHLKSDEFPWLTNIMNKNPKKIIISTSI